MAFTYALFASWIYSLDHGFESHMSHGVFFSGQDLSVLQKYHLILPEDDPGMES